MAVDELREQTDRLMKRSAESLIAFLKADLDLSFTILETAHISNNPEHTTAASGRVSRALSIIRALQERITDPEEWKAIDERAAELERALNSFPQRESVAEIPAKD